MAVWGGNPTAGVPPIPLTPVVAWFWAINRSYLYAFGGLYQNRSTPVRSLGSTLGNS